MTIAEILLLDYDQEISNTRRTLERLPDDLAEYKPHEKSMKLGKLAMHCARMPLFGLYVVEDDGMDMAASTRPQSDFTWTTTTDALAALDESSARCRAGNAWRASAPIQPPRIRRSRRRRARAGLAPARRSSAPASPSAR